MKNIKDLLVDTFEDLENSEHKLFQSYLSNGVDDFEKIGRAQLENVDRHGTVNKMVEMYSESRAVDITLAILKKMEKNHLALELWTKCTEGRAASSTAQPGVFPHTFSALCEDTQKKAEREKLKSNIISQYNSLHEGISGHWEYSSVNDIYTDLYVVEDWTRGVNTDHEVIHMEAGSSKHSTDTRVKFTEMFSGKCDSKKVLTLGIAGIGKTVFVQKFALDWAEGKSNADIDFVFIVPFRELNVLQEEPCNLQELLLYLYPDLKKLKEAGLFDGECKCLFIFDGLDEFRRSLAFQQKKVSITEKVCVDVLVTNLITGALLPSALVWITSRPAAANQISLNNVHIHLVTEVRGFTDQQKEEYFRKRISDEEQANKVISHIKQSKTLYVMCYIPIFCWIVYIVLQDVMTKAEVPKTLTQMYTNFLTIQIQTKDQKQNKHPQKDSTKLLESYKNLIAKLAELAFKQLMKGNVMFYEEDLIESGIDVTESVKFGIVTEILKEELVLQQKKVYCFVHLSFQEFLAAVYVFYCYENKNLEELQVFKPQYTDWSENVSLDDLLIGAAYKVVKSENGHLDLFLRFVLGISVESNWRLLRGLLTNTQSSSEKTTGYIKMLIKADYHHISTERSISFFLCLSEMNDQSLFREIQLYLKSEEHSEVMLSPAQCSTIAYILQTSGEVLDKLDLTKYRTSEEGYRRLIPAVSVCRKALLAGCYVSEASCETLSSALKSVNSLLRELDLSNNDLQDSGVKLLSAGLKSSHCKLETLRLAMCNLGEKAFENLGSSLQSVNYLKELDLSNNDMLDSGVKLLCHGLKSSHCNLEILRLSGCMITDKGCSSLASALTSNPSQLRELDLTYNHPGESGVKEFSDLLKDPHFKLEKVQSGRAELLDVFKHLSVTTGVKIVHQPANSITTRGPTNCAELLSLTLHLQGGPTRLKHGGEIRLRPRLKKYFCRLTLDHNTAHHHLVLSEENTVVKKSDQDQRYTDNPERFDRCPQVLSKESVSGRCYWEVEWSRQRRGSVYISVSYKEISRKGWGNQCPFGRNSRSWALECSSRLFSTLSFYHNNIKTELSADPSSSIGVYVDHSAGTLSFYNIDKGTLILLHRVHATFTQPLYAGFSVYTGTVRLCVGLD